jgi:hypothetical protein
MCIAIKYFIALLSILVPCDYCSIEINVYFNINVFCP